MSEDLTFNKKYDCLVIDSVNFAYRTFKTKNEIPVQVSKKSIYKDSICNFILSVETLRDKYLKSDGQVYLLFDNYFSKADLRSTYMFADRHKLDEAYKATRKKENKEFYNSLNFLRYYYLIGPSFYHTLRVENLEADDLVEPLFTKLHIFDKESSALMVTNDLDWTRYLDSNVDWLPDLKSIPETSKELESKLDFEVSKNNIILYKAIFGDVSDNISKLVTENESNKKEFKELLNIYSYPEDLINMSRDIDLRSTYKILEKIAEDERSFLVNLQLVSSIPCSVDVINCSLTSGRNAETLINTIKEAIGLTASEFVFGNIKRNRIS